MKSGTKGFFLGALVMLVIFITALRVSEMKNLYISLITLEVNGRDKINH